MAVTVTFFNPAFKSQQIEELGSGTYDYLRFSAGTSGSSIVSGYYQDSTWISDDAGGVLAGASGRLPNNKYISSTNVTITDASGAAVATDITLASITGTGLIGGGPDFDNSESGTILIKLQSDASEVFRVLSGYVWVDDGAGAAPTTANYYAFEYDVSGVPTSTWTSINGSGTNLDGALALTPHVSTNGYDLSQDHWFSVAISAQANSSGAVSGRLRTQFFFGDA